MPRCSPTNRLALAAALLALLVRLLLPVLHDHHAPDHGSGTGSGHPAVCACGHHHAPTRDVGAPERAERTDPAAATDHACLACLLQASTPGSPPPPALPFALHAAAHRLHGAPAHAPPTEPTHHLPQSRAPPRAS